MQASLADVREQAIFGYFIDDELAGMVGVRRETKAKVRHQSMIWGMYVAPRARGKGAGRSLLLAAIEYARAWQDVEQLHLGVTTGAPAAARLYEAAGFRQWGYQHRAIQHDGIFVDEAHMVLDVRGEPENSPSL
jgi:RimJ/RimL family protein N-acetyltransferase